MGVRRTRSVSWIRKCVPARLAAGNLRALARAGVFAVSSAVVAPARAAESSLAGTWSAGPLVENVNVPAWIDECGPKPKSRSAGGGSYIVTTSGDELIFSGSPPFRTDGCWDQGPARRVSHSATPSLRAWKTRCESAPEDPRRATITTVVRAVSDDTIVLSETAHYQTTLAGGTCSADVERSRTFRLTPPVAASAPGSTASAASSSSAPIPVVTPPATRPAAPTRSCVSPGDAATLEVRPRRKIVRPGEQFDFTGRVIDAAGCELPLKVAFRLAPESAAFSELVLVDAAGRVRARADAEPATAFIVAEGGAKSARVELEIVTDQRYAALLGTSGLDDAGAEDRAVSIVLSGDTGSIDAVTDVRDRGGNDERARRRFAYVAIGGGVVTLLVLLGAVILRRGAGAKKRLRTRLAGEGPISITDAGGRSGGVVGATYDAFDDHRRAAASPGGTGSSRRPAAHVGAAISDPARVAAAALRRRALGERALLGGGTLVGLPDLADPRSLSSSAPVAALGPRMCPVCRQRFPTDASYCPADGERLILVEGAAGIVRAESSPTDAPPGRICPVCGKRYARDVSFCGRDGVELVPLN